MRRECLVVVQHNTDELFALAAHFYSGSSLCQQAIDGLSQLIIFLYRSTRTLDTGRAPEQVRSLKACTAKPAPTIEMVLSGHQTCNKRKTLTPFSVSSFLLQGR